MDLQLAHALNAWAAHHDGPEDALSAYASASEVLFAALVVGLFVLAAGRLRQPARRTAVAAAASAGLALLLGQALAHLVERARPFVTHPHEIRLFAPHAADGSFPSDHATAAFAIATAIALRHRVAGLVALAAAALLAVARVVIGVHYPSDVLAGAALGAAVALGLGTPPLRRRLDALADASGAVLDAAVLRARRVARPRA